MLRLPLNSSFSRVSGQRSFFIRRDPAQQVPVARCERYLYRALTPSPVAVVEFGELRGRRTKVRKQASQRFGTLHTDIRTEHCAVIHVHRLDRDAVTMDEGDADGAVR